MQFLKTKKKDTWFINLRKVEKSTLCTAKKLLELKWIAKVECKKNMVFIHTFPGLCLTGKEPLINAIETFYSKKPIVTILQIPIQLKNSNTCQGKKCNFMNCPIIVAAFLWYTEHENATQKEAQQLTETREDNMKTQLEAYQLLELKEEFQQLIKMLEYHEKEKILSPISIHYQIHASTLERAYDATNMINDILYAYHIIDYQLPIIDVEKVFLGEETWVEYPACIFLHLNCLLQMESSDHKNSNIASINLSKQVLSFLQHNINKGIYLLIDSSNLLESFLKEQPKLQIAYTKKLEIPDLSMKNITNFILQQLKSSYEWQSGFEQQLYHYINNNYKYSPFHNIEYGNYLYQAIVERACIEKSKCIFARYLPPDIESEPATLTELNALIGLHSVKQEVQNLRDFLIYNQKLREITDKAPVLNLHMMFLGNPGTGKTTVARLIAQILYELGYVRSNKVIEADKKTFTGQYVGQSTVKTKEVLERAIGGVLFIDEAYALGEKGSFNEEIVATIIKEMEDHRNELIIIFAGYTTSMERFFQMNEGLRSRIGRTLYFDDYTSKELTEIVIKKFKENDYKLAPGSIEQINEICENATGQSDFGNGRFADLLFQKIVRSHAALYQDKNDILMITKEDVLFSKKLL